MEYEWRNNTEQSHAFMIDVVITNSFKLSRDRNCVIMDVKLKANVPDTEFSHTFVQGMADRMSLSYYKYGAVSEAYPTKVDALNSAQLRISRYLETGNKEYLIDAANFLMIESMCPSHANAYMIAEDSNASPGRRWKSGDVTQASNTLSKENTRLGGVKGKTANGFYRREGD